MLQRVNVRAQLVPRDAGGGFDSKHVFSPNGAIGAQAIVDGRLVLAYQTSKRRLATECLAGPCEGRIKFILNCHTLSMGTSIYESMGKTI